MSKFYVYDNASRRLRSGQFTYSFDVIEQFGGNWRGVLKLDDPEQIAALEGFGPRLGVKEISEEEYNGWLKKKLNSKSPSPDTTPRQTSAIKVGAAGAVVIKDPSSRTTPKGVSVETNPSKPAIDSVIVVGSAPYVDPLEQRTKTKRRKNASE